MVPARVKLTNDGIWYDCQIDDSIPGADDLTTAKAAVEAWWLASSNYRGNYDVSTPGRVTDVQRINDVFHCMVDSGRTYVALDLSQAGGPW